MTNLRTDVSKGSTRAVLVWVVWTVQKNLLWVLDVIFLFFWGGHFFFLESIYRLDVDQLSITK